MLTSAKLDATGHRWLAALSIYNFSLKYRSGVQNIDADALSLVTSPIQKSEWKDIPATGVRAMCQMSAVTKQKNLQSGRAIDLLWISPQAIPQPYCNLASLSVKNMPGSHQVVKRSAGRPWHRTSVVISEQGQYHPS